MKGEHEQGGVLVYVAICITAMLVVATISLETGLLTHAKSRAQAAVDAAVLAGAYGILDGRVNGDAALPDTRIASFIEREGFAAPSVTENESRINLSAENESHPTPVQVAYFDVQGQPTNAALSAYSVEVTKTYNVDHFLPEFAGRSDTDLTVKAKAAIGGTVACYKPELPFVLINWQGPTLNAGSCYGTSFTNEESQVEEWNNAHGGDVQTFNPSTMDTLAWFSDDPNQQLTAELCHDTMTQLVSWIKKEPGSTNPIKELCVGDPVSLNNGSLTECLGEVHNAWTQPVNCTANYSETNQDRYCYDEFYNPSFQYEVVVPVINLKCDAQGNCQNPNQTAPIAAFARLKITDVAVPHGQEYGGVASADNQHVIFKVATNQNIHGRFMEGQYCGLAATSSAPLLVKAN